MSDLAVVILAAGKGTRMKSALPKVLHKVAGQPMLAHVLDAAEAAGCKEKIVVVGYGAAKVSIFLEERAQTVEQAEQLGTGHAVAQTESLLKDFPGTVMVLCGDTPLLDGRELRNLYEYHVEQRNAATLLTALLADPTGYGRVIRNEDGKVIKVVEQKDAVADELLVKEINTGIYCFNCQELFEALRIVDCDNVQGEYYLTDVVAKLVEKGLTVGAMTTDDHESVMGINSQVQLAEAEKWLRRKINRHFMEAGVTIMDLENTYIDSTVAIGQDSVIYPFTWLEGQTVIAENCVIGPNTRLTNIKVGSDSTVQFTCAQDAIFGKFVNVGPYAHIRPGTRLADNVKVGNFVEVKNSWIGAGTKLPHLTYVGDAELGENVNLGCGCITVNYDGQKKYRTVIKDNAFIGCNTNLIAPVTVGENTYIAAGSTINKEVPDNALAVARAKQKNIEGWKKREN